MTDNFTARKILIIRFSSLGDVLQSLSIPAKIKNQDSPFQSAKIHFLTRSDFKDLVEKNPYIDQRFFFEKGSGVKGLWKLLLLLRKENYTFIYDAHNSTRSKIIKSFLWFTGVFLNLKNGLSILTKSQNRWKRFLLFRLRRNHFELPFSGQRDFLQPLKDWGFDSRSPKTPVLFIPERHFDKPRKIFSDKISRPFITLAPMAAHALKRWPLEYWQKLVTENPGQFFVALGSEPERTELDQIKGQNFLNLAGQLSIMESGAMIMLSRLLISNDTGLMHIAEQTGKNCIALMGPAPFGFPSRPNTVILQRDLYCRPCSKHGQGPCVNPEFQKCLRDISVSEVSHVLNRILNIPEEVTI